MLKTMLFDLDGTLLPMDTDGFVAEYLKLLSQRMAGHIPPAELPGLLMASTLAMVANDDPAVTNAEAFFADFWPRVQRPESELLPLFDAFYRDDFPNLRRCVEGDIATGRAVVETALGRGYEIVLATNPLFPAVAIHERIRWAGLTDLPWRHVTTFEDMHYCKPQPGFYHELLERIGRRPEECLMIGNDVEEDGAAARLGIGVHLVTDYLINRHGKPLPAGSGPLADVPELIRRLP